MRTSEIKKRLREESKTVVPDVWESVLSEAKEEGLIRNTVQRRTKARRGNGKRLIGFLVAAAVVCLSVVLPITLSGAGTNLTVVCMRINPSVEFTVQNGEVTGVRALNKDGAVLLVHHSLTGLPAEEACETVAITAENLITEDGITVYVSGDDEEELEKKISDRLQAHNYKLKKTDGAYAEQLAERYEISKGKARVAAEVLTLFPQYAEEAVVKQPIQELHEILEDYDEGEMDDFEEHLLTEYQQEYEAYVQTVSGLLEEYEGDLNELDGMRQTDRLQQVPRFNEKYAMLGEDFQLDLEDGWREAYYECMEELKEVRRDVKKNAEETFADLFEDWLEEFREGHRSFD